MEKSLSIVKSSLPALLKNLKDWFEIELTIKLFGVKIFTFVWPPKNDDNEKQTI